MLVARTALRFPDERYTCHHCGSVLVLNSESECPWFAHTDELSDLRYALCSEAQLNYADFLPGLTRHHHFAVVSFIQPKIPDHGSR